MTTRGEYTLFDVPATGHVVSRRKPASVDRIKVNHTLAKKRYYLHKRLVKAVTIDGAKRTIEAPYKSFEEIPRGNTKYYIGQLLKLGYTIQYKLL